MIFQSYALAGNCLKELNTEIRYNVAVARADGCELISFAVAQLNDGPESKRLTGCITRVLSSMKREGHVQFFVKSLSDSTAEAEYINNKYSDFLPSGDTADVIYVKL